MRGALPWTADPCGRPDALNVSDGIISRVCVMPFCNRFADYGKALCNTHRKRFERCGSFEPTRVDHRAPRNPHGTQYVARLLRDIDAGLDLEGIDPEERRAIQGHRRDIAYRCGAHGLAVRAAINARKRAHSTSPRKSSTST